MRFSFTDEQSQFREAVRRFLNDKAPISEARRLMATASGYDRDVWREACVDLGLASVHIPERYGGLGAGFIELCITLEEMGRVLFCAPFFSSSVLAANAILNAASETYKQKLLPEIASGRQIATLAVAEHGGHWDATDIGLRASADGDSYRLNGIKKFVTDGAIADIVIVVGQSPRPAPSNDLSLYLVAGESPGLERRPLNVIDPTRKQAELTFSDVVATRIGEFGNDAAALHLTIDQAAIALANEMAGGCQILLESAVEYAQLRMQFGRLIGSFQAVKHKCADMLVDVEQAKSAAYYAAAAAADGDADLSAVAATAKATVSDAYMRIAAECIQIHGGIGFTWDNNTHLWFKRAKNSEVFLGSPALHRERYMQSIEAQP
jgi:alkylation response protein AidB-like acyl-CoA dehydrogenase